jgi:hypothetical protein
VDAGGDFGIGDRVDKFCNAAAGNDLDFANAGDGFGGGDIFRWRRAERLWSDLGRQHVFEWFSAGRSVSHDGLGKPGFRGDSGGAVVCVEGVWVSVSAGKGPTGEIK